MLTEWPCSCLALAVLFEEELDCVLELHPHSHPMPCSLSLIPPINPPAITSLSSPALWSCTRGTATFPLSPWLSFLTLVCGGKVGFYPFNNWRVQNEPLFIQSTASCTGMPGPVSTSRCWGMGLSSAALLPPLPRPLPMKWGKALDKPNIWLFFFFFFQPRRHELHTIFRIVCKKVLAR